MVTEEDIDRVTEAVDEKLAGGDRQEEPPRGEQASEDAGETGLTNEELNTLVENAPLAPEAHKEYSEQAEGVATAIREGDMDSALEKAIAFRDEVQNTATCAVCEELANNLVEDVAAAASCALAEDECLEVKEDALRQAENVRDVFAPEPENEQR